MDPNSGNPYMQGSNPFMQGEPGAGSPPPVAPGDVMGDMGMGGGSSETTKPRQMPGGPDPVDPMMGMPAPEGGSSDIPGASPSPSVPGAPSAAADPMKTGALLREVRRDITSSNPDLGVREAHALAMRVVAMVVESASPMGPTAAPPDPLGRNSPTRPRLAPDGLPINDPRNPANPRSVMHPRHADHGKYYTQGQSRRPGQSVDPSTQGEQDDAPDDGRWRPRNYGRNPLEDRANARGYQGNNPNLFGLGDAIVQRMVQKGAPAVQRAQQRVRNRVGPGDRGATL